MSHCPLHKLNREQRTLATKLVYSVKEPYPGCKARFQLNPLLEPFTPKVQKQEQTKKTNAK